MSIGPGGSRGGSARLEWRTERRRVRDLVPWEGNPRKISEKQAEQLRASLDRFGVADIPVIDADGTIVGGHQRCAILMAQGKGDLEVDVRVPSRKLTGDEFAELNLRLNRNLGAWDFDVLADMDEDLLLSVGFDEEELLVGFGLSRAEDSAQDPDRYCLQTVDSPDTNRLKMRLSLFCETEQEFEEFRAALGKDARGYELDREKILDLLRAAGPRA